MKEKCLMDEKLYHVLYTHYNMSEANALCRMINDDAMNLATFKRNFTTIRFQQPKNTSDEKYINWIESLSV
jgi:hypothetical protein